jgi:predicted RND superfamily exporter protein
MGTGISVSVTTYTTLAFMESRAKTRQARIDDAMAQVGISVLNGALSTVIGVFMLAFAEYSIFRTYYFKMYMAVVIFGIFYGLVFLPVFLSLIGPSYARDELLEMDSKDEDSSQYLSVSDHADVQ